MSRKGSRGTAASRRPRVICHMMASVDGRIVVDGWPRTAELREQYELVHASYEADGWICGRVTMEPFAGRMRSDAEVAHERAGGAPREDFRAPGEHDSFAFAIALCGRGPSPAPSAGGVQAAGSEATRTIGEADGGGLYAAEHGASLRKPERSHAVSLQPHPLGPDQGGGARGVVAHRGWPRAPRARGRASSALRHAS